jgi:hypothetical protein
MGPLPEPIDAKEEPASGGSPWGDPWPSAGRTDGRPRGLPCASAGRFQWPPMGESHGRRQRQEGGTAGAQFLEHGSDNDTLRTTNDTLSNGADNARITRPDSTSRRRPHPARRSTTPSRAWQLLWLRPPAALWGGSHGRREACRRSGARQRRKPPTCPGSGQRAAERVEVGRRPAVEHAPEPVVDRRPHRRRRVEDTHVDEGSPEDPLHRDDVQLSGVETPGSASAADRRPEGVGSAPIERERTRHRVPTHRPPGRGRRPAPLRCCGPARACRS